MPQTIALIVAAGTGERARSGERAREEELAPKQYRKLAGKPVLRWTIESFIRHPAIDGVRVVIREGDEQRYEDCVVGLKLPSAVLGGATRQDSVRNGLEALASPTPPERVLIH